MFGLCELRQQYRDVDGGWRGVGGGRVGCGARQAVILHGERGVQGWGGEVSLSGSHACGGKRVCAKASTGWQVGCAGVIEKTQEGGLMGRM